MIRSGTGATTRPRRANFAEVFSALMIASDHSPSLMQMIAPENTRALFRATPMGQTLALEHQARVEYAF
jgi:hypothetical protein